MMRFLARWVFRLFILLLACAVALILSKDVLVKSLVEHHIRARSGMDVNIGRLELGLLSPTLTLEDVRIFNRAEFGGSPFLEMPDLHLEYDVGALARRRLHLFLLRLTVTEINVVEARNGQTNLAFALPDLATDAPPSQADDFRLFGLKFGGIDTLNLSVGKIRYTSFRRPESTTQVALGVRNAVYTHIRSVTDLKNLVTRTLFGNGFTITIAPRRRNAVSRRSRTGSPAGSQPNHKAAEPGR
jgi:uncharacterized protein involved in outer membrane biogenesis